jgi:aminoglycoside phosphotransferase (APT) family kinase protein
MRDADHDELVSAACDLLAGAEPAECTVVTHGQFHDVVTAPGVGVLRVARDPGRESELRRVSDLCMRLSAVLPFPVPVPLGPVQTIAGRPAVATSWVSGESASRASERPAGARHLLAALRSVDLEGLEDVLAPPRAYAGGAAWPDVMLHDVVPRLPQRLRGEATQRIEDVLALDTPDPSLVHGDLAGDNVLWHGDEIAGVLDWDLAAAWDPAVDAACLAWHGWPTVRQITDRDTYQRAVAWFRVFGLEQIAADLRAGANEAQLEATVQQIATWLTDAPSPPAW